MTRPMYCPLTMIVPKPDVEGVLDTFPRECTPDCAWAVETDQGQYGCCITQMCASTAYMNVGIPLKASVRPLKDDADIEEALHEAERKLANIDEWARISQEARERMDDAE